MPIEFHCECGKKVKAPDSLVGKRVRCPHCQNIIQVPTAVLDAEEVPAPPPQPAGYSIQADEEAESPAAEDDRRPCPMCGEMIRSNAVKCRFCGEIFDETLRRAEKKKAGKGGADLTAGEYVLAVLCPGIGCIAGIIWMIQGQPKGPKMFGISVLMSIIYNVINVVLQQAVK